MNVDIPENMRAIITEGHGEPEVMRLSTAPTPIPGINEVLVKKVSGNAAAEVISMPLGVLMQRGAEATQYSA